MLHCLLAFQTNVVHDKSEHRRTIMKSKLLMPGAIAALFLGGCATYSGGTADDSATIEGWGTSYGRAVPVYTTGSPNGQDMGGTRPDIIFYR
jgi:hypothetical protein